MKAKRFHIYFFKILLVSLLLSIYFMNVTSMHVYTHGMSLENHTTSKDKKETSHEESCPYYTFVSHGQGFITSSYTMEIDIPIQQEVYQEEIQSVEDIFIQKKEYSYCSLRAPPTLI